MNRSPACLGLALLLSTASAAAGDPGQYVVQAGDSCESVALKVYGDPRRYDLLHAANPELGVPPHKLRPGQTLRVPKTEPDARVTFIRNEVDVATPAARRAARNEPLSRGHKVITHAESSAEVTFSDATRLQLGEQTLVVILGSTSSRAAAAKLGVNTDLLRGSLRAHLAELAGKRASASISTPGAKVGLGAGEASVQVDGKSATRLTVYRGAGTLTARGKRVEVGAGFSSSAEVGKTPTAPKPLPPAPSWSSPLPELVLTQAGEVDVAASYAPAAGGTVARWHVQLAREAAFNDLVVDARVPVEVTRIDARKLAPGEYHARVAALDAEAVEGKWGAVSTVRVVRPRVVEALGQPPTLEVGAGLWCSLDGAPFALVTAPLPAVPGRLHALRCAPTEASAGAAQQVSLQVAERPVVPSAPVAAPPPAASASAAPSAVAVPLAPSAPSVPPLQEGSVGVGAPTGQPAFVLGPRKGFDVGFTTGARLTGGELGHGFGVSVEGAYVLPGRVEWLSVGLRLGVERLAGWAAPVTNPSATTLAATSFELSAPLTARLGPARWLAHPTLSLSPTLLLLHAESRFAQASGELVTPHSVVANGGFTALLGTRLALFGAHSSDLVLEGGVRVVAGPSAVAGAGAPITGVLNIGWRGSF